MIYRLRQYIMMFFFLVFLLCLAAMAVGMVVDAIHGNTGNVSFGLHNPWTEFNTETWGVAVAYLAVGVLGLAAIFTMAMYAFHADRTADRRPARPPGPELPPAFARLFSG